jgi:hypothetical protein
MLSIVAFIIITIGWLDRIFDATGKQHVALLWEIAHTIATLSALYIGLRWLKDPIIAVALYVAFDILFECAWVRLAYDAAGFHFTELLKTIRAVGQSALLFVLLMLATLFANQSWRLGLSAVLTGAVVAVIAVREVTPKGATFSAASSN